MGFRRKSHDLWKSVPHFHEKEEYNYNMWLEMTQTIEINRSKIQTCELLVQTTLEERKGSDKKFYNFTV